MSTTAAHPDLSTMRRAVVIAVLAVALGAAVAANATVKRHRQANSQGAQSAVAFVNPSGRAHSTAWYCPGPLALGLAHERSQLVIANAAAHAVSGQLLVATTDGQSFTYSVTVAPDSTRDVALPLLKKSTFAAASLLSDGAGIGVEEVTDGTTGRVAAPCVVNPSLNDYIPAGSTKGASDVVLSLYDPGATPSVANVRFVTANGSQYPLALQGLPINAGEVVVVDVGKDVAQSGVVATEVAASGGSLVVGAIERAEVGTVAVPSLLSGDGAGASTWYLPALPAGGSTLNYVYVEDVGSSPTTASISFASANNDNEVATVHVGAGGVARLTQGPESSLGQLRFAKIDSKVPVVVEESSQLSSPLDVPGPVANQARQSGKASGTAANALSTSIEGLPPKIPTGFAVTNATVTSDEWLLPGGVSNAKAGEFVTFANPTSAPAVISLSTVAHRSVTVIAKASSIVVPAGSTAAVALSRVLPNEANVTVLVTSTTRIVVAAGLYAKGSSGSVVGFSEPVAIPVD
jgi:Family of unknown function (DUF5719)